MSIANKRFGLLKCHGKKKILTKASFFIFIKCLICTKIGKKEKVLVIKWSPIQEHERKRKNVDGTWIMDSKCVHVKYEIAYVQLVTTIVLHTFE